MIPVSSQARRIAQQLLFLSVRMLARLSESFATCDVGGNAVEREAHRTSSPNALAARLRPTAAGAIMNRRSLPRRSRGGEGGAETQDAMVIDADTLRDLDVITTSVPRGKTLLDLIDWTRTRSGREHLRRRLTMWTPSSSAIVALQGAHQLLAADSGTYRTILDRAHPDGVERYVNSNWQHPDSKSRLTILVDGVWRPRCWPKSSTWRAAAWHGVVEARRRLGPAGRVRRFAAAA